MEEKGSRKRGLSLTEDDESNKPPMAKRVRFPKGRKVKAEELPGVIIGAAQAPLPADAAHAASVDLSDPRAAALERAKRRSQFTTEQFSEENLGIPRDISVAEVDYEDAADFVDDGIQIEPFNLNQEREEGYFDANGNFVEYANDNQIKDAWLDSVDVDSRYTGKNSDTTKVEEDTPDLSSEDVGEMKRRIADLLEPEETVLQALRRFKGTSNDRKVKMPEDIKRKFDQLTEDSMKLMENGDYNVYHEKREVFEREAEGYERLARAKGGTSKSVDNGDSEVNAGLSIFPNGTNNGVASVPLSQPGLGPSDPSVSTTQNSSGNADEEFDIFADDDETPTLIPSTNESGLATGPTESVSLPSVETLHTTLESGGAENDYVYDESSGYYYNSSLGYYYDSTSGMYCCANSGKWYSYNEQTSIYEEVQGEAQ